MWNVALFVYKLTQNPMHVFGKISWSVMYASIVENGNKRDKQTTLYLKRVAIFKSKLCWIKIV